MNAMTTAESLGMQHPVEHGTTCYLPHTLVHPSKTNPRKRFPEESLSELARSLKQLGQLQPIVVRPHPDLAGQYELIAGERRWRATGMNGDEFILARVVHVSDLEALELQVIENMQREDLHPLEEAEGYEALMQSHADRTGYSVEEVAAKLGKSRAYIYGRMKLCALGPVAREAFYAGKLNASTALLVARLPNLAMQEQALREISREEFGGDPMPFRHAQAHIKRNYMLSLAQSPFPITDATLLPSAGSCRECPKRTGANPDLFADVGSADVCTDPDCHAAKVEAHTERVRQLAEEAGKKIIDGAEAKKIVPYAGAWHLAGYVRLDERCNSAPAREITDDDAADVEAEREEHEDTYEGDPDAPEFEAPRTVQPRYRELLDPQTSAEVVTIVDPHSGVPFEAIPTKAVAQALQAKGIEDWRVQNSRSSADTRAENKEKRHKQRVEVAYRNRLIDDVRAALQRGEPANDDAGSVRHLHTVILAASLFDRSPPKTKRQLCTMFGWEVPGYGYLDIDVARKRFDALDHQQIAEALILLIVLPAIEIDDYHNPSCVELVDIAESLGIGTKAIRREIANGMKPKAKPAKEKATPKPRVHKPKAPEAEASPAAPPAVPTPIAVGDRVRVKEDSRGPGGKRLKVCGREGTASAVDLTRVAVNFDDGSVHANLQHDQLDVLSATADSSPADSVEGTVRTVGQRAQVKGDAKGLNGRPLPHRRRTGKIIDVMNQSARIQWDDGKKPAWVLLEDLIELPPLKETAVEPEQASDQDNNAATPAAEVDA